MRAAMMVSISSLREEATPLGPHWPRLRRYDVLARGIVTRQSRDVLHDSGRKPRARPTSSRRRALSTTLGIVTASWIFYRKSAECDMTKRNGLSNRATEPVATLPAEQAHEVGTVVGSLLKDGMQTSSALISTITVAEFIRRGQSGAEGPVV